MPRLIFVNRFFFPDHSATSQILSDLAFHLADTGHEVHVIASRQIYDDAGATLLNEEIVNGVHVHRVASTRFGRGALAGRALDYLSFYRSVDRCLTELARPGDVVIAKTDPPLVAVIALAAARTSGARLVNWLQDIYPETAVVLGVPLIRGPIAASLAALRNRSLRRAAATVVVGKLMGRAAASHGAPPETIHVIPNWCDDEHIKPIAPAANPLRRAWGLADKFVFGYSGNLGRAHEFRTVLAAAERLRDDARFVFLMIGGGKRFHELKRIVTQRSLNGSFRFMPYQGRAELPYSLGVPDAHWLSLDPRLEGLIVPSKFYGIVAAGKPIVVIGDNDGELGALVQQYGFGFAVAPGDADALVDALRRMARQPEVVAQMGARARATLEAQFGRQRGLARWRQLLDGLVERQPD